MWSFSNELSSAIFRQNRKLKAPRMPITICVTLWQLALPLIFIFAAEWRLWQKIFSTDGASNCDLPKKYVEYRFGRFELYRFFQLNSEDHELDVYFIATHKHWTVEPKNAGGHFNGVNNLPSIFALAEWIINKRKTNQEREKRLNQNIYIVCLWWCAIKC